MTFLPFRSNHLRRSKGNVTLTCICEFLDISFNEYYCVSPSVASLWDILKHHEESGQAGRLIPPPEDGREPVIVYTMRRISGQDLKTTTLKSLGLTSGKCMLR